MRTMSCLGLLLLVLLLGGHLAGEELTQVVVERYLAEGRQSDIEQLLAEAPTLTDEARFCQAVLIRSRFNITRSLPLFSELKGRLGNGVHGRACTAMVSIDSSRALREEAYTTLSVAGRTSGDSMVLWLACIASRDLRRNAEGVALYALLEQRWTPGPVLLHQTYANLLVDLGRYAEALPHRRLAVAQEKAPWSLQGLGATLIDLRRYAEGETVLDEALALQPDHLLSLNAMGECKFRLKKYDEAIAILQRAKALAPRRAFAPSWLGLVYEEQGKPDLAAAELQQAFLLEPDSTVTAKNLARVLRALGRGPEADEVLARNRAARSGIDRAP